METFTVQAVYKNGVFRLMKDLDLPENTLVSMTIISVRPLNRRRKLGAEVTTLDSDNRRSSHGDTPCPMPTNAR